MIQDIGAQTALDTDELADLSDDDLRVVYRAVKEGDTGGDGDGDGEGEATSGATLTGEQRSTLVGYVAAETGNTVETVAGWPDDALATLADEHTDTAADYSAGMQDAPGSDLTARAGNTGGSDDASDYSSGVGQ